MALWMYFMLSATYWRTQGEDSLQGNDGTLTIAECCYGCLLVFSVSWIWTTGTFFNTASDDMSRSRRNTVWADGESTVALRAQRTATSEIKTNKTQTNSENIFINLQHLSCKCSQHNQIHNCASTQLTKVFPGDTKNLHGCIIIHLFALVQSFNFKSYKALNNKYVPAGFTTF